jgi:CRISPR-associated protein (TIGR02584 family)
MGTRLADPMDRRPHQFPKRILLATIGLVPQVVTETVYALATEPEAAFVPTDVHIITTNEGAHRVRLALLDPRDGKWRLLAADLGMPSLAGALQPENIHIIKDRNGETLDDIVDLDQNAAAADTITRIVADLTRDPDAALYVSIAGGRKTMGFLLGYALSLFGRAQDRLSHILVDSPFEQHPEFFYPPNPPRVLFDRQQRPVSTADARLHLAEIPMVRLRHGLPQAMLAGEVSYSETVQSLSEQFHPPSLRISLIDRTVQCQGRPIPLSDILIAWYALFAARRLEHADPYEAALARDVVPRDIFLDLYAQLVGQESGAFENTETALTDPIDRTYADEKTSRINTILRRELAAAASPYLLTIQGR